MKVDSARLRAAQVFQASADIRYYLNGIHINKNWIEATNGHAAVRMKSGIKTRLDVIIKFGKKITKRACRTQLNFGKVCTAIHFDSLGLAIDSQLFEVVDGKFPDISKVIDIAVDNPDGEMPIISAKYLSLISRAFPYEFTGVKQSVTSSSSGNIYKITGCREMEYGNPIVIIMPIKGES